jgi:putative nucleotidyltransferase with HDIG domain
MTSPRTEIIQLIERSSALPDLPNLITELTELEAQPDTSTADMARLISSDSELSARVLRLVNSPFYGFSRSITSIANALVLLGINIIKSLILSSSIFELMQKTAPGLWRHSLATAVTANIIASQLELDDIEEITTAALLHDIGKVVVIVYLMDDYENILARKTQKDISSCYVERAMLLTDHAEIGGWLAQKWLLPIKLQEVIACHHEVAESVEYRTATSVVHYANMLATGRGLGFNGDKQVMPVDEIARQTLVLPDYMLSNIIVDLEQRLEEINRYCSNEQL